LVETDDEGLRFKLLVVWSCLIAFMRFFQDGRERKTKKR
jgi:hypothetical protein